MNAQVNMSPATLAERIRAIRYYDIAALCREVKGEALGFDFNRKFAGTGSKARFAQWAVENLNNTALELALPKYEETARTYYNRKPARPATKTAPRVESVPMPEPATPTPAPRAEPEPEPTTAQVAPVSADLAALTRDILGKAAAMDAAAVKDLRAYVQHELAACRPVMVTVNNGGAITSTVIGRQHKGFDRLLKLCAVRNGKGTGLNVWLTGPAGSGKTTAAENVAKALAIPFHFSGAMDNEYKVIGFIDAGGRCIRTAFREAYENGGVFLLDEVDGCHPAALLALNAALANGYCDFPDGQVKRHKDTVIIAAANTWGQGATHEYVGRAKLDAASLDRFVMMAWDYDEALERDTCGNEAWARKVQAWRGRIISAGIKAILSPRASYDGASLLAHGFTESDVIELTVKKGLSADQWRQIS